MTRVLAAWLLLIGMSLAVSGQDDWEKVRSIAEAQHDIVMLLIKNKEFDKVLPASKKIFGLNFPQNREPLLVNHAQILSDSLIQSRQFALAHRILDEALKSVRSNKSKATLLKEKALVCTKEGKDKEAVRYLQEAVKMEETRQ